MATYELRPMSLGEILDGAFTLLGRHFGKLLTVSIVSLVVPMALGVYVESAGGVIVRPGLWLLAQVLGLLGYVLVSGATVWIVSEVYLGRPASAGDALRFAFRKTWPILVVFLFLTILLGLSFLPAGLALWGSLMMFGVGGGPTFLAGIVVGLLLFALPVIVMAGYAVVVQAAVLETLPAATHALGRSWSLTRGHRGKVVLLWIVIGVLLGVAAAGVSLIWGAPGQPGGGAVVSSALIGLLSILIYPLSSCIFTLLYYDLRVRKEAFDLELLSKQIGLAPTEA